MNNKQLISRELELFYNRSSEENRLETGMGSYEFERIQLLIEKYLPPAPSVILDIGGGTGKYAAWLAKKGHEVHLVEPVDKHLELAQRRAKRLKNTYHIYRGEARQLPFKDGFADIVILHGPLYHLQLKKDRVTAIEEAKRVLKKGGIVLGFAINYTASTLVGLIQGLIHKKPFFNLCKTELTSGIHNPPDDFPWLMIEGYYHRPKELKQEFLSAGLIYLNTFAVEGIIWLDKNFFANLINQSKRSNLMELVRITEDDPELLSLSPHIMIAAQKQ